MNYGSICSGVEAASLAWRGLGWTPVFFSEVEPFPSAVLCRRLGATKPLRPLEPANADNEKERKQRENWRKQLAGLPEKGEVPNLGDFTLIKKDDYNGKIDLLVGGTPCQDLSIAGKRMGFGGKRSVLALDFVRLCFETGTRWVVWENVPATLSSRNGRDFAAFLSLLCGWDIPVPGDGWRKSGIVTGATGHFGVSWRVLDAQYTRVSQFPRAIPQRRKRLFLVGYLGNWKNPAKVLFDGEMRGGNTPPCRTKGQTAAAGTESGVDAAKSIRIRCGKPGGGKGALIGDNLSHTPATGNDQTIVAFPGETRWWDGSDQAGTLTVTSDRQLMPDCGRLQCVVEPQKDRAVGICYENHGQDSRVKPVEVSQAITARMGTGGNNLPFVRNAEPAGVDGGTANVRPVSEAAVYNRNSSGNRGNDIAVNPVAATEKRCGNEAQRKDGELSDDGAVIGFMKNDAGGGQQGFRKNVFPALRAAITPPITWNECFHLSFRDASGTGKDRENGGLCITETGTSRTVTAKGRHADAFVIALDGDKMAKAERQGGSGFGINEDGAMYTQTVKDVHAVAYEEPVGIDPYNGAVTGKAAATLGVNCGISTGRNGVLGEDKPVGIDLFNGKETRDVAATVSANSCATSTRNGPSVAECFRPVLTDDVRGRGKHAAACRQATVRRLMPVECERLMGFPDNWTRIVWRGKPETECPDAPRYKACGNSMCVNVMAWLGERIDAVEKEIASGNAVSDEDKPNNGGADE